MAEQQQEAIPVNIGNINDGAMIEAFDIEFRTVGSGDAVLGTDDGISQSVEIKSGTVTRNSVALPADGVELIAWRTFRDAHPVVSRFLLRMKAVKDALPKIALFEIDAKWELDTVGSVRNWIEKNVEGAKIIA